MPEAVFRETRLTSSSALGTDDRFCESERLFELPINGGMKRIFLISFMAVAPGPLLAADSGVSPYAYELFRVLGLPVTNAMVTSWVISLLLILAIRLAVGKPGLIPSKGQAVVESLVTGVRDIISPIVGRHMVGPTFPLLVGLFTFILIQNWSGLLPGVGAWGTYDEQGQFTYFQRPGNADLNMTLALALIHFIAWIYLVLRYAGPGVLFYDLFGNKADRKEVPAVMFYALFLVFFLVGLIEVVSILFRNVSLPFRLYGNVIGGENLLTSMLSLPKGIGFIAAFPFYLLELLIGFVQALVFTILVAVYVGLICNHGDDEEAGHGHAAAHG